MTAPNETYDIIFTGGGAAACATAGRLALADPSLKILILEQGPHTLGLSEHTVPAKFFGHLVPTTKTLSFNFAQPNPNLDGRSVMIPSGRCVGGGSSVNFMLYTRGSASDYDDWEKEHENKGWGVKGLLPLLKKTETYQIKPDQETHGYSGPLKVSNGGHFVNVAQEFLEVASKYDSSRKTTEDVNGLYTVNEYGRWPKWIDGKTGARQDAAHHFIYNQLDNNKNLHLLAGRKVKRVIFEGDKAVGVEYQLDSAVHPDGEKTVFTAHASKLVVLSAGAFGNPAILERSGVGAKSLLEKLNIPVVLDLPGVGEAYQDHNLVILPYHAANEAETHDDLFRGEETALEKNLALFEKGQGLLAHNTFDAGIKLRPDAKDLKELGPAFEKRWKEYYEHAEDKAVLWFGLSSVLLADHSVMPPGNYVTPGYFSLYPIAKGSVHIASTEIDAPVIFKDGFLEDPADEAVLRWGYKKTREFLRRMKLVRGRVAAMHPQLPAGSKAAYESDERAAIDAPDLEYSAEDEKAISDFHKKNVGTTWHSMGTCAMRPREKGGVVDHNLNVYGLKNLKVADLSICPSNVGGNTYSTALVIGEKAAAIIAEELGLKNF